MNLSEIEIYLPKHLSAESKAELFEGLRDFPNNLDSRFYTSHLKDLIIYQGDGIKEMLAVNLPGMAVKKVTGLVLSNTCDLDINNNRVFPAQIVYAPIIELKKYEEGLANLIKHDKLISHIAALKKQTVTQILYLPKFEDLLNESIVFLDRVYHIPNDFIDRANLDKLRIFSLSDYGNYMFLFKLSLHFTRIQDKVDRRSVRI